MKERAAAALRKTRRLQALGSVVGRKAFKVFASGPMAGAVYGSDLYGVSDRELLNLRRMAMSCIRPRSQGRSLSVLCLLEGDPTWRASCAPIIRWSKEIWILRTNAFPWSLSSPYQCVQKLLLHSKTVPRLKKSFLHCKALLIRCHLSAEHMVASYGFSPSL